MRRDRVVDVRAASKKKRGPSIKAGTAKPAKQQQQSAERPAPRLTPETLGTNRLRVATRYIQRVKTEAKTRQIVPKKQQSYKLSDEERAQQRAEREADLLAASRYKGMAHFGLLYDSKGLKKPPVLLVDGYNLIGYLTTRKLFWQHQRKYGKRSISVHEVQMTDEQKEEAFSQVGRDKLLRRLSAYSGTKDVKVVCVFDAMDGPSRGDADVQKQYGIEVVYSGAQEADNFIMHKTAEYIEADSPMCMVVTSDLVMHATINKVHVMQVPAFVRELEEVEQAGAEFQRNHQFDSNVNVRSVGIGSMLQVANAPVFQQLLKRPPGPIQLARVREQETAEDEQK